MSKANLGELLKRERNVFKPGLLDLSPALEGLRRGQRTSDIERRRRKGRESIQSFCETYFKHHFTKGFGEHHLDMFKAIDEPGTGKRIVRIEPRKFGKTTVISLALPLFVLAYQLKWFILLVGEASTTSHSNLATITNELETNDLLVEDFPHLKPGRDGKGQITKWTDEQIVLASGATVLAKGMGSRMRGLKRLQHRPDLGIVDDPESPETASSFVTRQRHKKWFGGTFLGLGGDDWDVYVIGNMPHHDCLVADLCKSDEWDGKLYRAVNLPRREDERYPLGNTKTDGSALWPDGWPLEKLEAYRKDPTVGDLGFAREMMNDPRDDKDKPFNSSDFTYFDFQPEMVKNYRFLATFVDPAGGEKPGELKKGRRDWAAIVTGGRTKDGFIDIFDVVMTRVTPEKQIEAILQVYKQFKPRLIGLEENQYKNFMGPRILDEARKRSLYPHLREQFQTGNKLQRILATQPLIANGTVRFARHLRDKIPDYFGQYDDCPGDHDDGPDATEGLIRIMEASAAFGAPSGSTSTSYWRKGQG